MPWVAAGTALPRNSYLGVGRHVGGNRSRK